MRYTIAVVVKDIPGVMTRIAGLFSRRGFNIESLTVGRTEQEGRSRFTIVVDEDARTLDQVIKQLQRLINAVKVERIYEGSSVEREYALIKVKDQIDLRRELLTTVEIFQGKILDASEGTLIIEVTGNEQDVDAALELLKAYNIKESIRTGKISLNRGNMTVMKKNAGESTRNK